MKIEIKHRFSGSVLFTHDEAENTIKTTLMAAVRTGADLRSADLRGANLSDADLSGAYIDYSYGWKFACSCSRFKIGIKFAYQVLAHLSSCTSDDPEFEEIKKVILPYAQKSHRAINLGLFDNNEDTSNEK